MALGLRTTKDLVSLTGWDDTALAAFTLQDGTSFAEIVADINTALNALNGEIAGDPTWSSLVSYDEAPDVEYHVGSSNGFSTYSEHTRPDAQRAATEGHMLPLIAKDRALGWTWKYLKEARTSQIVADVREAITDARTLYRVQVLTRALKRTDDSGAAKGLGSSGYSAGFATAAASTNVDFVPPTSLGNTFTSAHEHYVGIAGGLYTLAVFQDAYSELWEHGHVGPFDFWISETDRSTVEGLTGFVPAAESLIRYGSTQDLANVGDGYLGVIENFRVRVMPGMPQYYGIGFKSYGSNSQRNPIRIRVPKGMSSLEFTAMSDPSSGAGAAYPLQYLMLYTEFGVGVGDRTAGTPRYVNNATWADGTPT